MITSFNLTHTTANQEFINTQNQQLYSYRTAVQSINKFRISKKRISSNKLPAFVRIKMPLQRYISPVLFNNYIKNQIGIKYHYDMDPLDSQSILYYFFLSIHNLAYGLSSAAEESIKHDLFLKNFQPTSWQSDILEKFPIYYIVDYEGIPSPYVSIPYKSPNSLNYGEFEDMTWWRILFYGEPIDFNNFLMLDYFDNDSLEWKVNKLDKNVKDSFFSKEYFRYLHLANLLDSPSYRDGAIRPHVFPPQTQFFERKIRYLPDEEENNRTVFSWYLADTRGQGFAKKWSKIRSNERSIKKFFEKKPSKNRTTRSVKERPVSESHESLVKLNIPRFLDLNTYETLVIISGLPTIIRRILILLIKILRILLSNLIADIIWIIRTIKIRWFRNLFLRYIDRFERYTQKFDAVYQLYPSPSNYSYVPREIYLSVPDLEGVEALRENGFMNLEYRYEDPLKINLGHFGPSFLRGTDLGLGIGKKIVNFEPAIRTYEDVKAWIKLQQKKLRGEDPNEKLSNTTRTYLNHELFIIKKDNLKDLTRKLYQEAKTSSRAGEFIFVPSLDNYRNLRKNETFTSSFYSSREIYLINFSPEQNLEQKNEEIFKNLLPVVTKTNEFNYYIFFGTTEEEILELIKSLKLYNPDLLLSFDKLTLENFLSATYIFQQEEIIPVHISNISRKLNQIDKGYFLNLELESQFSKSTETPAVFSNKLAFIKRFRVGKVLSSIKGGSMKLFNFMKMGTCKATQFIGDRFKKEEEYDPELDRNPPKEWHECENDEDNQAYEAWKSRGPSQQSICPPGPVPEKLKMRYFPELEQQEREERIKKQQEERKRKKEEEEKKKCLDELYRMIDEPHKVVDPDNPNAYTMSKEEWDAQLMERLDEQHKKLLEKAKESKKNLELNKDKKGNNDKQISKAEEGDKAEAKAKEENKANAEEETEAKVKDGNKAKAEEGNKAKEGKGDNDKQINKTNESNTPKELDKDKQIIKLEEPSKFKLIDKKPLKNVQIALEVLQLQEYLNRLHP